MSKIDEIQNREKLIEILTAVANWEGTPESLTNPREGGIYDIDEPYFLERVAYLRDHGYCTVNALYPQNGGCGWTFGGPIRITTAGMDWLAKDGGLTAEKRTITIKLAEDDLRALLTRKIHESDAPESKKRELTHQISTLSQKGIGIAAQEVVKQAVDHAQNALPWIETALRHLV
ncbi:hypothetical protein [Gluconobacter albidus]|uniref:hypothetical protein n=1 Tax=Gluconobacter albidus TaxID=318683 RepID=UPI000780FDF2|nr:hypothetical protein [Gluconobacter albidus]